jgi:ribose transport system substrate-binding protein
VAGGVCVVAACTALVACGSDSDTKSSEGASAPSGAATSTAAADANTLLPPMPKNTGGADVEQAQCLLLKALAPPKFNDPGPAFDMTKAAGKSVWMLDCPLSIVFCQLIKKGFEDAAKVAGIKFTSRDFVTPADASRLIYEAINQKADVIVTVSLDPKSAAKPLKDARAKGIKIIDANNTEPGDPPEEGTDATVTFPYIQAGRNGAAYAIATSGADANGLCVTVPQFVTLSDECTGFSQEIKRLCPSCQAEQMNVTIQSVATNVGPQVQAKLRANPKLTWLLGSYADITNAAVPAIIQAGFKDRVRAGTAGAQPDPNLKWVQQGHVQMFDGGAAHPEWLGWQYIDQAARLLVTGKPAENPVVPLAFFTHESLAAKKGVELKFDNFGELTGLPNETWQDGYKKLWGVG